MGVYINTWNSITKAQVEADENLNVIYEVDDNTKIRAIELKDNKDSYAVSQCVYNMYDKKGE